jgi:hypothetical protein
MPPVIRRPRTVGRRAVSCKIYSNIDARADGTMMKRSQSAMRRLPGEFNGRARVRDENGEEGAGGVV